MKKDLLIFLLVLIPAAILMLFIAKNFSSQRLTNPFANNNPFPTISRTTNQVTQSEQITPASSANIEVLSPLTGDSVKSGFIVKGNARTFESTVNIRLLDSNGEALIETSTIANAPDAGKFGPFDKAINFSTSDSSGILEVFQYSAKDGSEIDKVMVPVIFVK